MKIIPKRQKGGSFDAFFTTYMPVQTETPKQTSSSQRSTGSTGQSSEKGKLTEKDFFDMIKDIDGLPNEMNNIVMNLINTFQLSNLTGADPGDLATTYLSNLYQIKIAAQNKKKYDQALDNASKNGALAEPAISMDGKLIVQNEDGSVKTISLSEYNSNRDEYSERVLTVSNLANMRQYDPSLINDQSVFSIINNSVGFEEFQSLLDTAKITLENSSFSESGITNKNALLGLSSMSNLNNEQRAQVLQSALDGLYSYSSTVTSNEKQLQDLIIYMNAVLPKRAKVWAAWKLGMDDENQAANVLITQYLSGKLNNSRDLKVDFKGSYNKFTGTKDNPQGLMLEQEYNTPMKWLEGMGVKSTFILNPGTINSYQVRTNTMPLTKSNGDPVGVGGNLLIASQGEYSGILDFNNASIGGNIISPYSFSGIVLSDGKISSVDYPINLEEYNRTGIILPDNSPKTIKARQRADSELQAMGININDETSIKQNYEVINQVYQKYELTPKYNPDGSTNQLWRRFGVINVAVNNNILNMNDLDDNPLLKEVTDEATIDNIIQMSNDANFDKPGIFGGDHIYQGTLWIPIQESYQAAAITTKTTGKDVLNTEYAEQARDARVNWKSGRQPK